MATARRFVQERAKVVICDVNSDAGREVVKILGEDANFYGVDISNRAAVQQWVEDVVAKYGRVDVLVNNPGIVRDAQLVKMRDRELVSQMPEVDFDRVVAVNLKGVFNCTQAVAPFMVRQESGVILNATSVVGIDGNFGQTNYVAAKSGVIGMTKVWARELGRYGIRVNAVAPGFTMTEIISSMPQKIVNSMVERTPAAPAHRAARGYRQRLSSPGIR